ncbi:hypothetical protein HDV02_004920 [Globomyces sp. JEL0801]|nr:hypothetical protein HDV02_004920 [Globomyces sp. JEL0801]
MSQQFQSYVVEGYLHTWMIDDDYFDWALIGKDNQGGYVSHRSQSSLNAEFKPDSHLDEESNMGPEIVTEDASSSNDKNAHDEL